MERIDELEAKQLQLHKAVAEQQCDSCEAESLCGSHQDAPIKLTVSL
jgi:serine O-acetyltransferase